MIEEEGEIAPLDADRLDDYKGREAVVAELSIDDLAIKSIFEKLKTKRPHTSEDILFEMAENIYVQTMTLLESGSATADQFEKAATLFSESSVSLRKRTSI